MRGQIQLGQPETPSTTDAQRGLLTIIDGATGVADNLVWVKKNAADAIVLESVDLSGKVSKTGDTMTGALEIHRDGLTTFAVKDATGTTSYLVVDTTFGEVQFGNGTKGLWFSDGSTSLAGNVTVNIDGATGVIQLLKGATIGTGSGTPEGAVSATVGSIFLRSNGGAGTTLYVKESGSGNTGWVAQNSTLDATLVALAAYNTNGLLTQTAADTFTGRTITGTASEITVVNGSGVGGNPTISLASGIDATKIGGGGVTSTEFNTLANVTSDIQAQLNAKMAATIYVVTYGPFYINDLPGTATTRMAPGFFNTATALSQGAFDIRAGRTGEVIGVTILSDAARTAGTATAQVRLNGTATAFATGGCVLNASDTSSDTSMVAPGGGIAISSGNDTIGLAIVTSGWTPTTANLQGWLHVAYTAI